MTQSFSGFNDYHKMVFNMLADRLKPEEREWLDRKTAPLTRV